MGDPESDWTIFLASRYPGMEHAFWETYGPLASTPGAARRSLFSRGWHLSGVRLERHRLGRSTDAPGTYDKVRDVLARLTA